MSSRLGRVVAIALVIAAGAAFAVALIRRRPEPRPASLVPDSVRVVVNEVAFDPPAGEPEWVEVHNPGEPLDVGGMTVTDASRTTIATVPDVTMPSGSHLVIRFDSGVDDLDLADGSGVVHAGGDDVLGDVAGEVALYAGRRQLGSLSGDMPASSRRLVDLVVYGFDTRPSPGDAQRDAVRAGRWTGGDLFEDAVFPTQGSAIGRDSLSTDTDGSRDWFGGGGVHAIAATPGARNLSPAVAFSLDAGAATPCTPPAAGTLERLRGLVEKELKQIRSSHMDAYNPPDLADAGLRGWDGKTITSSSGNEVRFDNVVVKICTGLKGGHPGLDAAGLTPFPSGKDRPGDPWVVLVDADNFAGLTGEVQRVKDILIHELAHVALNRNTSKGAWRDAGGGKWVPATDARQKAVLPCHEVLAYSVDLALLQQLLKDPELPAAEAGWVRDRITEKTKLVKAELGECRAALKKLRGAEARVRAELAREVSVVMAVVSEKLKAQAATARQKAAVDAYVRQVGEELVAAGAPRRSPSPTPTPAPQPSQRLSPTTAVTATPTASPSPAGGSPSPTAAASPTAAPSPTASPSPSPTPPPQHTPPPQ